jgi:hypothetical protein
MIKVAIILGSTRPNRNDEAVAKWVYRIAKKRRDAEFELVDIKDFNLPLLDEPIPPSLNQYTKPHTRRGTDFENFSVFKPGPDQETSVNAMLDQVIAWGNVLKGLRGK